MPESGSIGASDRLSTQPLGARVSERERSGHVEFNNV